MYDHNLHHGRKHFRRYCLQTFSSEKMLKSHIKDFLKINGKQRIIMHKNVNLFERQIKSPFIIYADFESILVPEYNKQQNPNESYTNKYQRHIDCNYDCKLVCVDGKFSNPFKSYSGKDAVYDFIKSMVKESNY